MRNFGKNNSTHSVGFQDGALLRWGAPVFFEVGMYFGVIVCRDSVMSVRDLSKIAEETGLSPFFVVLYDEDFLTAKRLSRLMSAPCAMAEGISKFEALSSGFAFSVCESAKGALFSFLCAIPCYIDIKRERNRELIALAYSLSRQRLLIPYSRGRLTKIRKVGAKSSDFNITFDLISRKLTL